MPRNAPLGVVFSRRADWVQELACATKCFDVAVTVLALEECLSCRGNSANVHVVLESSRQFIGIDTYSFAVS